VRSKMPKKLNYRADLLEDLRNDIGYAAKYLSAAIADSKEAFLIALRDVAEAQKGMSQVAQQAKVNRENLYRMLSEEGNPRFSTLDSVLGVLGMSLTVQLKQPTTGQSVPSTTSNTSEQTIAAASEPSSNIHITTTMPTEFSNVVAVRNIPIFTNPAVTAQNMRSAITFAGEFLPGFVSHAIGEDRRITVFGD